MRLAAYRALKTGGAEVAREKWDEADAEPDPDGDVPMLPETPKSPHSILPDWTRSPLPVGAPSARPAAAQSSIDIIVVPPQQTLIGA